MEIQDGVGPTAPPVLGPVFLGHIFKLLTLLALLSLSSLEISITYMSLLIR
jgi:hypothetical protein